MTNRLAVVDLIVVDAPFRNGFWGELNVGPNCPEAGFQKFKLGKSWLKSIKNAKLLLKPGGVFSRLFRANNERRLHERSHRQEVSRGGRGPQRAVVPTGP
jgi:hypothetical protein